MALRARSRLGKYRILSRIAQGGAASVYRAYDTVEGLQVALKVPEGEWARGALLDAFRKEIRLNARLDHPNILRIKNADVIDGRLVVAYPLGKETLGDRMQRRIAVSTAVDYARQCLDALAYAHARRVLHCDVKPDNLILFADNQLCLSDFGLSRVSLRTMRASGSGTLGYMAPEQAMGRPSFRSDVFAAGLVLYRLFAGRLPEWPFEWPPRGIERLRKTLPRALEAFLRKALSVNSRQRFANAIHMRDAFAEIVPAIHARLERDRHARRRHKK
jgi:serine/threonine-protein kinase